jgi:regulatory protein
VARRREPRKVEEPPDLGAAVEIGLRFLGTRPRTSAELERRLLRAGCESQTVEAALARLTELGFVDDEAFARWWSEQRDRHAPRGRRLVEAELRQRGVPREVVEALRESAPNRREEDEGLPETEEQRARAALDRHLRGRPMPTETQAVQRIGTFLLRRGFDTETVRRAIRERSVGD